MVPWIILTPLTALSPVHSPAILLESGFYLLTEDGFRILLEP